MAIIFFFFTLVDKSGDIKCICFQSSLYEKFQVSILFMNYYFLRIFLKPKIYVFNLYPHPFSNLNFSKFFLDISHRFL